MPNGPWGKQLSRQVQYWLKGSQHKTVTLPKTPQLSRDPLLNFVTQAETLAQVWAFLQQWLAHEALGSLWLTTMQGYTLTLRYSWPQLAEPVKLDTQRNQGHHLEQCAQTGDTTFCHGLAGLGEYLGQVLPQEAPTQYFSVPLRVGNATQAIITLGFHQVTPETQRLVSRVYAQKELLAQLVAQCELRDVYAQKAMQDGSSLCPQHLDAQGISQSLIAAIAAKDPYTAGHSCAVAEYAYKLAQWIGLTEADIWPIRLAGQLHDVGKIGIPDHILRKPGPLTADEWEIMHTHPTIGAEQILAPLPAMRPVAPLVLHHHEHWDGSGYPYGLAGDAIPLGSRLVAIVDAYHGLTSTRTYRGALSRAETLAQLQRDSGALWDPELLQAFTLLVKTQPG